LKLKCSNLKLHCYFLFIWIFSSVGCVKYSNNTLDVYCTDTHTCRRHLNERGVRTHFELKLQARVDHQVCAVRFLTWEDVAPRRPTSPTNILRIQWQGRSETHTHTDTHTTVLLLFWNMSRYQKGKTRQVNTNLDLLEQDIVSDSGICWAICKSAPHPRQPCQHPTTQFFTGRMPFLPPNQQRQSTEGMFIACRWYQIVITLC